MVRPLENAATTESGGPARSVATLSQDRMDAQHRRPAAIKGGEFPQVTAPRSSTGMVRSARILCSRRKVHAAVAR